MQRFETMHSGQRDVISLEAHAPDIDEARLDELLSPEAMKDYLFDEYMKQNMLDGFFESMYDHFDDNQIERIRETMADLSDEEVVSILSLPYELRESQFARWGAVIEQGHDPADVIKNFVSVLSAHNFGVGYHTSPFDIRPNEEGRWDIKGTEPDHRDDDVLMAYYSTQYRHLFKKKNPKFIYAVRTEPKSHKTDGNWSRAAALSVIARVPLEDVVDYVESTCAKRRAAREEAAQV
jgi:hypothetical protein